MAVIIGNGTVAEFGSACVLSANWAFNPNAQRFYCLGEASPRHELTIYKPSQTLSLTIYAQGGPGSIPVDASQGGICTLDYDVQAKISPAACETETSPSSGVGGEIGGSWFVTGYSYTKDNVAVPAQESWSLTRWADFTGVTTPSVGTVVYPTGYIRAISEGQAEDPNGLDGIQFDPQTTFQSSSGSVSANSMGKAQTMTAGIVLSVGGGTTTATHTGQGSASISITPLYI